MQVIPKLAVHELSNLLPGKVETNVSLKQYSRWRIGGNADVVVTPGTTEELIKLRKWISKNALPSVVIGSTSNLLFSDHGLRAIMIKMTNNFNQIKIDGNIITADAGVWVPMLARRAMVANLSGLEHISGIPGTLGGLIYMNGGSQRKGIGDSIIEVSSIDSYGNTIKRNKADCEFSYRKSIFQKNTEIIANVRLSLDTSTDKAELRRRILNILQARRKKFPQKHPNCGSVFVSNPAMYEEYGPPGKLIELAGLKGYQIGGAVVASEHANFINNLGDATAKDVTELIRTIREEVHKKFGYLMEVEARQVNQNGSIERI